MVAEWVLAIATVVLAVATIVLAWATWNLFRGTRQLERIEERRDADEARRRRRERLARKLRLGEEIISWHPETQWLLKDSGTGTEILGGNLRVGSDIQIFREFALFVDPHDEVSKHDLNAFLGWFDKLQRGEEIKGEPFARNFVENFVSVQEAIVKDLPRWRAEVLGFESAAIKP